MRTRITFGAVAVAAALVLTGCSSTSSPTPAGSSSGAAEAPAGETIKMGIAYDLAGRGDGGINDLAYEGVQEGAEALGLGLEIQEVSGKADETDSDRADRLRLLADGGFNPIVTVGFTYAAALSEVAPEFPDVSFAIVDDASLDIPNVAGLTFAEHEGSFLVGAAAALKSESGRVGFIGGVDTPLIKKFEEGFKAGVAEVNPDVTVDVTYLTQPPDFTGFGDPAKGKEAATGMYDNGADIVYSAAGSSGNGVFDAAEAAGKKAIGVDFDQYLAVAEPTREVIMTSMLKNVNVATRAFFEAFIKREPLSGNHEFGLANDGVGYSLSGGGVEDITAELDALKARIVAGEITVPFS